MKSNGMGIGLSFISGCWVFKIIILNRDLGGFLGLIGFFFLGDHVLTTACPFLSEPELNELNNFLNLLSILLIQKFCKF